MKHSAVLLLLFAVGCGSKKELTGYRKVLDEAESYELYSLLPREKDEDSEKPEKGKADREKFHGYVVLGKMTLDRGKTREKVNEALFKGLDEGGDPAKCFNPRHGIRATQNGKTVDLVICFECSQVHIDFDGDQSGSTISKSPQPVFNEVLRDARARAD